MLTVQKNGHPGKNIIALPWPLAVGDNMLIDIFLVFFTNGAHQSHSHTHYYLFLLVIFVSGHKTGQTTKIERFEAGCKNTHFLYCRPSVKPHFTDGLSFFLLAVFTVVMFTKQLAHSAEFVFLM